MPYWLHSSLSKTSFLINSLQAFIGKSLCWLALAMVLATSGVVFSRSLLGIGSVATQELIAYFHAALFMLTLGFTALADGHVRVDIYYRRLNDHQKAWVNLIGSIVFLLPFSLFLALSSLGMVEQSWLFKEGSNNPGGLPYVYLLKSLMPLGAALLALHAISSICTNLITVSCKQGTSTHG